MGRAIVYSIVLLGSIFWLPWWVSAVLCVVAIATSRYAAIFLVPALAMDLIYAPGNGSFFANITATLIVLGLLCIKYFISTKTRVEHLYDPSKR